MWSRGAPGRGGSLGNQWAESPSAADEAQAKSEQGDSSEGTLLMDIPQSPD